LSRHSSFVILSSFEFRHSTLVILPGHPVLSILHISDLHFGPPYMPVVGEALLRIIERLAADVIVASGDFTQRARREQFIAAREYLNRLPDVPIVVVPGNHDVPLYRVYERLANPHDLYREYIQPELDHVLELDEATIVALDSTAPRHAISNGRLRRWQLDFCSAAFSETPPEKARIVVAHHHFAPAPDYEGSEVMPKARRALDLFARLKVDLILGGHLHRAYIGNSLDVYPGEDREHGIIIVQCGTSTSRRGRGREREKNSFNHIRLDTEQVEIVHYMYFDDASGFAPVSRHYFPRARRQFFREGLG
jgi:3',5'-cyclic AMP phosphodiesterase CpdA